MTVDLSNVTFVNDFAYIDCENGGILILNKLEEAFTKGTGEVKIRNVNMAFVDVDDNYYDCNMAVGLENDFIHLYSDHKEQEGKPLTVDNLSLCYIEVFDE